MSDKLKILQDTIIDADLNIIDDAYITSLSGNNNQPLSIDNNGKIQRHDYAPIIGGQIPLNIVDSVYSITDSNITTSSNPVCTIVPPISASTIYGHSVYNVQNGSFTVELSESPAISGYNLNWMSLQYV